MANSFKLYLGTFGLDIRKKLFTGRVVRHWSRLLGEVMGSPPCKYSETYVDIVLREMT